MHIDIITLHPEMMEGFFNYSILKRAREKGKADINLINLREYGLGKHRQVDDYPYGGGGGMVLMIEPIDNCISDLKKKRNYDEIIYTAPDGALFEQKTANRLSQLQNLIILCGHYKGVDERVREHLITMEISIGNYVLTGGELPAAVIADACIRLIPGVLGDESSALDDSFQDGLVSPPAYTRPAEYKGWKVPEILLSGHEQLVKEWKLEQSIKRTKERRPPN
ncbi:MAG: tRNA (guanosine(37)-N1)-methyltransferase TrmD [Bacteroidia bacterium]|nr:tRNA (guanosine(37)-N1)-methyltransferase TrmD [Bacteroidia bacterium]